MVAEIEQIVDGVEFAETEIAARDSRNMRERCNDALEQLEHSALGRTVLSAMRWGVVVALIAAGFFGADAVNNGVKLAGDTAQPTSQQILATSHAK